jgi:two-component system response regulator MprA
MQGGRILIVDDEPMVRETIAQVLRDEGYTVEVADDGRDALIKLDAHRPDAVLLDLMMPGMNGRQFLTALREERGDAALPVVVMTAVHGVGERALSLGATDIVEKPFDVDDLLGKIALAVYRSREHERSADYAAATTVASDLLADAPAAVLEGAGDRGVVFLIHHDREALQRLDAMLSSRSRPPPGQSRSRRIARGASTRARRGSCGVMRAIETTA